MVVRVQEIGDFVTTSERRAILRERLILNAPPAPPTFRSMINEYPQSDEEYNKLQAWRAAAWAIVYADAVLAQLDAEK